MSKRFRVSLEPGVSLPNMSLTIQVSLSFGFKVTPRCDGLVAVDLARVVPAVHQVAAQDDLGGRGDRGPHARVVEGDRVAEEDRARVVPVVLRLDHLGAHRGHELAGVPLHLAGEQADVGLLDVLVDLLAVALRLVGRRRGRRSCRSRGRSRKPDPALGRDAPWRSSTSARLSENVLCWTSKVRSDRDRPC